MIGVLIVDDQAVVCEGLRVILNAHPNVEVVGVAHNGAEALELLPDLNPDLVLMDLKMPVMDGIRATRTIREQFPGVVVLVLTTYADDESIFDGIRAGAAGYILKDSPREDILAAIEGCAGRFAHPFENRRHQTCSDQFASPSAFIHNRSIIAKERIWLCG